jgi:hypothetical protein
MDLPRSQIHVWSIYSPETKDPSQIPRASGGPSTRDTLWRRSTHFAADSRLSAYQEEVHHSKCNVGESTRCNAFRKPILWCHTGSWVSKGKAKGVRQRSRLPIHSPRIWRYRVVPSLPSYLNIISFSSLLSQEGRRQESFHFGLE